MSFRYYDPRVKIDAANVDDGSVIWSTQSIDIAINAISKGQQLKKYPFLLGNPELKRPAITFQNSDKETLEIVKCSYDIIYFAENYIYLKTDKGRISLKEAGGLRDYQIEMLRDYQKHKFNIVLSSRQIGKTVTTAIFMLWYAIFNYDKKIAILGNKGATGKQILQEVKDMYKALPYFLKPGLEGWNTTNISFDNNCKILTRATTEDSLQGLSIDLLFLDEFAYVRDRLQRPFWSNVFPTISSMKNSKVIISSTPNGKNLFYELWKDSVDKKNEFNAIRVDWWRVPGRDEKWRKKEMSNIGEAAFKQQYELSFDTTLEQLINSDTMAFLSDQIDEYIPMGDFIHIDERFDKYLQIKNDTNIDFEKDFMLFTVDIAEGLGGDHNDEPDYSTIIGARLEYDNETNKVSFRQIIRFKCNGINTPDFAKYCAKLFVKFNASNIKAVVESNTYGDTFFYAIDNDDSIDIDNFIFVKFKRKQGDIHPTRGFRRNTDTKLIAVGLYKDVLEKHQYIITDMETLIEAENFQKDKRGHFNAMIGHDDLINNIVNGCYWIGCETTDYNVWIDDFKYAISANVKPINIIKENMAIQNINMNVFSPFDYGNDNNNSNLDYRQFLNSV